MKDTPQSKTDPVPVINYCLRNVDPEARRLLRSAGVQVIEDYCLQRCGQCYDGPFLVIDGEEVTACSHQEILNQYFST